MTIERWRKMSVRDQVTYLNRGEIEIESKLVFDSPRILGDVTAVKERYRARIGAVVMSHWKDSPIDARMAAAGNLKALQNRADYAKAN